ncbi:phosphopentomutase [[Mycoplasma] mobile]|uniref:Phosphopentomutase n=1 Tax=Mycoplasma mobile (strain ATCC 43663 / 163K / NCTC 11711) TaxID=267748 RepID=Q6KHX1_MYCM1|nr:phosphopentomutase [[Mycoplasma] mobile]AAT27805.1 phosphopentomutase [Mycoplasma mobile 163K]
MKFRRIFLIVTDGLGIGYEKRQKEFGDDKANSLYHTTLNAEVKIPTWQKLGIGHVAKIHNEGKRKNPKAYITKATTLSNAKDTLAGHWEMMGIFTKIPFPVFTETGFPKELLDNLSKACDGREIIGNKSASGTEILDELAQKEIDEKKLIVYTSGDSVLQICGHEETMGLENLYRYAKEARRICSSRPEWNVGRIIARPYTGSAGNWKRTFNRHDYAVTPTEETILDRLKAKKINTISVGKIQDIFAGQGINEHHPSGSDAIGMDVTIELAQKAKDNSFIFTNLVQFDSHYGHRRDVNGYAENLNTFDIKLTKLINSLKEDDLLLMTSDHGNDPTYRGTDHTREALPVTIFSKSFKDPKILKDFTSLATVGNIVAKNFGVELAKIGQDFFEELI